MSGDTIDKLIFALDGDLTGLKARYAEAEIGAQRTGTTIKTNLGSGFKEAAAAATQHSATIKKALGDVETATHGAHGAASTATREFRALFDEISSGRTRQSPGTLAIIATRVFGISGATLAWSVAMAAIPVAFAVAAFQAESALARIDDALRRTGNQAGVTRDQLVAMAQAGIPGLSESGALGTLGILAGRGNIAPGLLGNAARAVPGFARATDSSADKAAAELEKLLADPAKGAAQLNEEFKLLDLNTTREIERLKASGHTAEAQALLVKGLNDRFDGLAKSSWSLAAAFSGVGEKLSNFWFKTGTIFTGADQTKQEQAAALKAYNDTTLKTLAAAGITDPRATLAHSPGQGVNVGGGLRPLRTIMADFDANAAKIAALQKDIAAENAKAAAGRARPESDSAVGFGLKIAESYDEQAAKGKKLTEQLSALNIAIDKATGPNAKYREELTRERNAIQTALQHQMTPAQLAAQAAEDQRRVAAAPASQRPTLQAQIAAQREYERNLSNPSTAPYAKSILDSQMAVAGISNKDLGTAESERKKAEEEAKRMKEHLDAVISQAEGEENLAAAYDLGTAAAVRAKAEGEAHTALVKKEISNEEAYTAALLRKAFASEKVATAQKHIDDTLSLAGLRRVGAAGGDPAAIGKANEQNAALAATAKEFAAASTMADHMRAYADYERALSDEQQKNAANRLIASNKENQGIQDSIDLMELQESLAYADAGLRAKKIADLETIQQLVNEGYQRGTQEFDDEYSKRKALNETKAALGAKGEGGGQQLYTSFRNGLGDVLLAGTQGFKNMGQAASNFLKQIGDMAVQLFIIKPLLSMIFGTDSGGGGGILGGLFSKMTGISFGGGKASGGYVDPGKFYVVGENGPEILGPGAGGKITPLSAPQIGPSGSNQAPAAPVHMTYEITVAGNGDKDLLQRMHEVANTAVQGGLEDYSKVQNRTLRGQMINQNKRAMT